MKRHNSLLCLSIALMMVLAPLVKGDTIVGEGATFPKVIYEHWFSKYKTQTGITVVYRPLGSGAGVRAALERTTDFAASDAPLSKSDEAKAKSPILHVPTVAGSVALAYNLPGVTSLKLTGDIIASIYLGKIRFWNDQKIAELNPGVTLPNIPIRAVHRSDGSGTTYIFTQYLKTISPDWASSIGVGKIVSWPLGVGGNGSDSVIAIVRRTVGAMGYAELAYAVNNKLPTALIRNKAGKFVAPSPEATTAAISQFTNALAKDIKAVTINAPGDNSYPIASLSFILLDKAPRTNTAEVVKLLEWAMQPDQQKMAAQYHYAPLPPGIVKYNLDNLKSLKR